MTLELSSPPRRMPVWMAPLALSLVAVAAAGLTVWAHAAGDTPAPTTARAALTVNVTQPQAADWPQTLAANGSIAAWQEAVIGAETGGLRLVDVRVSVGDRVRRGQVLAQLQSQTLAADLAQTEASIAEAQATADEARANAERARQLQASGAISAQQIQQYVTAEATARARMASLAARRDADRVRLAQTRITAPDDGVISQRLATLGDVVQPGQALFHLIRQGRLEWRAEVPAADLATLKPGQAVNVTPAGGPPVRGVVRTVAPTVDATTRNGLVYVDLPAPGAARAGMFARGELALGQARVQTLPQSALLLRDGFWYVMQVGADQRVRQTKVEVGARVGDRVALRTALPADTRVVASGVGFLSDGDTVRVVDAAPTKAAAASAATLR